MNFESLIQVPSPLRFVEYDHAFDWRCDLVAKTLITKMVNVLNEAPNLPLGIRLAAGFAGIPHARYFITGKRLA